ncbi:MAG: cytosine permease [Blautia massiliensis (ex Durand et al. 2017)]
MSADSRKELEQHKNVVCEQLLRSYHNRRLGIGRPYARYRVERTLLEAGDALDMAQASDRRQQVYDPLSPQQLLLPIREVGKCRNFMTNFVERLRRKQRKKAWRTCFLQQGRMYSAMEILKTAKKLKQHENTIRYRINRLRNYLDVEEQPLLFHEIISLAVRIESMLEIKRIKRYESGTGKENRKCGICHIGTGSDGREKKLGRCCHDPGGNYDLCAQSDAGRNPGRVYADVSGHLVRGNRICSDRGVDDIFVESWEVILVYRHVLLHLAFLENRDHQKLISALFMISMIGWFAVQNGVCGSAFSNLIEASTGVKIPIPVSTVVWGIIMLVTAVYGINALDKLNKIAIPALVIVTVIGCVVAIQRFGTGNLSMTIEDPAMSFADGVVLTISFMATGALNAPDFTRYQRTRKRYSPFFCYRCDAGRNGYAYSRSGNDENCPAV